MQAGSLRHRIEIQQRTQVPDGIGGKTTTWSKYCYARAGIWPLRASEALEAMRLEHLITHQIRIRYVSGIDTSMRIKFGARYFDIVSIINREERNRTLDILAVEGDT